MNRFWVGTKNYNPGSNGIHYLVPHWTDGDTLEGAVSTLQDPAREASANWVIQNERAAQLVLEGDTSWHCGNGYYNSRSISYELVGRPGNPPTRKTLDTCAELMAGASKTFLGGARLVLGENVFLHRMIVATSCPGDTDITYLLEKANSIITGEDEDMTPEQNRMLEDVHNRLTRLDGEGHPVPEGHDMLGRICMMQHQLFRTDTAGHDNQEGHDIFGRVQVVEQDVRGINEKLDKLITMLK